MQQPEARILSWESGESYPSLAQARKAAKTYKRPLAVFYLSEVPKDFAPLRDYRRLPADVPAEFSHELQVLVRRAREQQEWAVGILQELGAEPLSYIGSYALDSNIQEIAVKARNLLGADMTDRNSLRGGDSTLLEWMESCERAGIFVFRTGDVKIEEMRGFTLIHPLAPVIVINSHDTIAAKLFTLLHEFSHVLLGAEGISSEGIYSFVSSSQVRTEEQRTEVFCNALAAEVLVPEADLVRRIEALGPTKDWDAAIETFSRSYKVSREVIARRLTDLRLITREEYRAKREQYKRDYEESKQEKHGEFRITFARRVVTRNGPAFTRLVINAYGERMITAPEASNLLNAKLDHFSKIENLVFTT